MDRVSTKRLADKINSELPDASEELDYRLMNGDEVARPVLLSFLNEWVFAPILNADPDVSGKLSKQPVRGRRIAWLHMRNDKRGDRDNANASNTVTAPRSPMSGVDASTSTLCHYP
jgi:hypothetical protein